MMSKTKLRIGTFNVENLFARYKFPDPTDPQPAEKVDLYLKNGWTIKDISFKMHNPRKREFTANAIHDLDADILALQEVENLDILKRFNSSYLSSRFKKNKRYKYYGLIDGNDPRFIDVGILSRYPIVHIRSYQYLRRPDHKWWLFSRDCLEVDVLLPGNKNFTLYINHFKSIIPSREKTAQKRSQQSKMVVEIVKNRFSNKLSSGSFVILGDLNDYRENGKASEGLTPLLNQPWLVDPIFRLPKDERWTFYFDRKNHYSQLDYILLPKELAQKNNKSVPIIIRKGQPLRAGGLDQYSGIGKDRPKASDHCPIAFDFDIKTI